MTNKRIKQRPRRESDLKIISDYLLHGKIDGQRKEKRDPNQVYEDLARLRKAIVLADYLDYIGYLHLVRMRDKDWRELSKTIGVNTPSEETKKVVLDLLKNREAIRAKFQKRHRRKS